MTVMITTLASFELGIEPNQPTLDADGNLFVTTRFGGAIGNGAVFEVPYSPFTGYASALTTLASFDSDDGSDPLSSLVTDSSGDLFGTTSGLLAAFEPPLSDGATVFEIANIASGYAGNPITLDTFNGTGGLTAATGNLVADGNGDLFGATLDSGTNAAFADGAVFEVPKTATGYANTPITLAVFNGTDGNDPTGGLIVDADGNLFGATSGGGTNNDGTVFEIAKTATSYAGTPTVLVSFTDGPGPDSGLVADANGDLFGTTSGDGTNNDGTVFEIAKTATGYASVPATLVAFNGTDGADLVGGLIVDADGDLFGTTRSGGANDLGTVFEIKNTATGYASIPTTLVSFDATSINGTNGGPFAGLSSDASGDLFGTTLAGAPNGDGRLFEITDSGFVPSLVDAYYEGFLQIAPSTATAQLVTSQLAAGTLAAAELQSQLLATAQSTTIPALVFYDYMNGVTPWSSGLTYLSAYATDLESGNYTDNDGLQLGTISGQYHSPEFSVQNTYVNLCAAYATVSGNAFDARYGGLAATDGVASRTTFFQTAYQQIFGLTPAAATTNFFVNGLVPDPLNPGNQITVFQYYINYAGSDLGGYGAVAGVLLWTAETDNLGPFAGAANAFLTEAATGLAVGNDTAPYGTNLITAFPQSTPQAGGTNAVATDVVTPDDGSVVNIVEVAHLIDPGAGSHTIRFLTGASNDTLTLHAGGTDQISGFDPATDDLDLRSLLSAASIELNGGTAALNKYVMVTDQDSDAVVAFDPLGKGGGSVVAVLQGLADSVTGLNSLLAQGAIKIT